MLTKRQVIEYARDHMLAQRDFATRPGGGCFYLSEGKRCAIGGLPGFPKSCEKSDSGASLLYKENPEFAALFDPEVTPDFLDFVQNSLHDGLSNMNFDEHLIIDAANHLLEKYC